MKIYSPIPFVFVFSLFLSENTLAQKLEEVKSDHSGHAHSNKLKYRASETRYFDLLHTKLNVSFNWQKQHLFGTADLTLRPYFYPQSSLDLDAKGMDIHTISIKKDTSYQSVNHEYDGNILTLNFNQEYSKTDTLDVRIKYTAKPNERIIQGSDAIKADKGLYFINPLNEEPHKPQQIWTQGETESNSAWFPTIDSPNERCTQEMLITVQSKFKTLSNGELMYSTSNNNGTRTDYWKMDKPHAPYLFMMTVGEFSVVEDEWKDVPLTYWVEQDYEKYAKDIFGNTPEMMNFFSELLGYDFPWKKYAQIVVRDYVSGAMENTSASIFMEELHKTKRELKDENWDAIIAHELFHQWFGDLVTTESWSNLTLNEGFADYSEYLWNEHKYGVDEADFNFRYTKSSYLQEAENEKKHLIRYYYDSREDMFDNHSYAKGALVLHMLRKYVGDDAFFNSLKFYLKKHAFTSVEINDLRLAFESVTGEDLNWFFDQWYLSIGHPVLDISHEYKNDTLYMSIDQIQNTDSVPVFQIPVFVDIWVDNEKKSYPVIIEEQSELYKFPLGKAPQLVDFDSEKQLLAEINYPKSGKELLFQYQNASKLGSRYDVLFSLSSIEDDSINHALLNLALNDPFHNIREGAISYVIDGGYKAKKFLPTILELAKDKDSGVRSSAIYFLSQVGFKKHQDIIYEALNDESYLVIAYALAGINEAKGKLTAEQVKSLETINNVDVILPLAEYFIKNKRTDKYTWFLDKLARLPGNELFYFIQYFSEFLIDAPEEHREKSVSTFEKLAKNNSNYLVRLSALQGLILLSDIKGVDKKIEHIKKLEKDGRLIDIYQGM